MTFADFEEARHYVEMKRAGGVTSFDDTSALDLIEALCDLRASGAEVYTEDQYNDAIESAQAEAKESALSDAQEVAEACGVEFLLECLERAIKHERTSAVEEVESLWSKREQAVLTREREALAKLAKPKRARKPKIANAGGNATGEGA